MELRATEISRAFKMVSRSFHRNWYALEENSIVHIDGKAYIRSEYTVDFGPKNGCCRVEVLDPCITEEAQQKRREDKRTASRSALRRRVIWMHVSLFLSGLFFGLAIGGVVL